MLRSLLLSLLVALAPAAVAQSSGTFPPTSDVLATSYRWVLDPEFNLSKNLLTWVDPSNGNIWVSSIDPVTGNFVPANGQGTLIEKGAAPLGGLGFTLNGPEWALGGSTDYVVYTRFPVGAAPTPANALIGVAYQTSTGWTRKTLSGVRNGPYGSLSRGDVAKITYDDALGNHYWRNVTDALTEEALPGLTGAGQFPVARFVTGENLVVYPVTVGGVAQSFAYNLDTHALVQLTFDSGDKSQPWMWHAPEYSNDLMLLSTVNKSTLAIYRQALNAGDSSTTWQVMTVATAPLNGTFFSTEPFVYQGHSYVLAQITLPGDVYPTSIWLIGFDPTNPIMRQLTPNQPTGHARADPEIFFTSKGPIVFYSRFDPTKGAQWLCLPCLDGLYRADTGLPAPGP